MDNSLAAMFAAHANGTLPPVGGGFARRLAPAVARRRCRPLAPSPPPRRRIARCVDSCAAVAGIILTTAEYAIALESKWAITMAVFAMIVEAQVSGSQVARA